MASNEAPGHRSEPADEPDRVGGSLEDDALGRLEERLDRASVAAERLLADAASRITAKPPPAGWQRRAPAGEGGESGRWTAGEGELLLGLLEAVRDRIPPELQQRLAEAVREALLALRALIDWYLEHVERQRSDAPEVQDIPIL
jgi:hypothetical protein